MQKITEMLTSIKLYCEIEKNFSKHGNKCKKSCFLILLIIIPAITPILQTAITSILQNKGAVTTPNDKALEEIEPSNFNSNEIHIVNPDHHLYCGDVIVNILSSQENGAEVLRLEPDNAAAGQAGQRQYPR